MHSEDGNAGGINGTSKGMRLAGSRPLCREGVAHVSERWESGWLFMGWDGARSQKPAEQPAVELFQLGDVWIGPGQGIWQ